MKKLILLFGICLVLYNCNNDDDQPDPIQEPDLSFPACLLTDDIDEYRLIMSSPPPTTSWRAVINKYRYNYRYYYAFNIFGDVEYDRNRYSDNCEIFCTSYSDGSFDCPLDYANGTENLGVVWTDPR